MSKYVLLLFLLFGVVLIACQPVPIDEAAEKKAVEKQIRASIEWALTKDKDALFGSMTQDSTLFFFQTDSRSTVNGFDQFAENVDEVFMDDRFVATRTDIQDLRITLSRSGTVAWFACILDDYGEWDGREIGWEDCRWTGVLEKLDGHWRIRQMHFSLAEDQVAAEAKESED